MNPSNGFTQSNLSVFFFVSVKNAVCGLLLIVSASPQRMISPLLLLLLLLVCLGFVSAQDFGTLVECDQVLLSRCAIFRDIFHTLFFCQPIEPIKPNQVPCIKFDDCGICLGDNSSCTDCAGVVNGDALLDACGVCNGDGSSCASQVNGDSTFIASAGSNLLSAVAIVVAVAAAN